MNGFNSLKHAQHFDAHNLKEKNKENERKKCSVQIFQNTCNITKYFEN